MGVMRRNEVEGRATQVLHLIFVTNFPLGTSAKQLWDICEQYGKVVDSFIPARVSKEGKKYAFVRLIKVSNIDVLVGNHNTIWIGKLPVSNDARHHKSEKLMEDKPVMVIDEDKNFELTLVAKVKTFDSMPNLRIIFKDEGFEYVTIRYLGGFWVSLEFTDIHAHDSFKRHKGMDTWISVIQPWKNDFRVDERVLWVDVEGIPLVAWTNKTFIKIAKRWGELVFTKDYNDNILWRKRLCVVTKFEYFIMESFKIIIKGRVTVIRARNIIGWIPDFIEKENETSSNSGDEESENSTPYTDICSGVNKIGSRESDVKGDMDNNNGDVREVKSDDPFGIYILLNHKDKNKEGESLVSEDPLKPPGFSKIIVEDNIVSEKEDGQTSGEGITVRVTLSSVKAGGGSDKDSALPKGKCPRIASSLLEKMNEFVEIGQSMGFSMDGCVNDIEKLISKK
ncbi:RNA-directed DNA polymerase, eukaryota, nucleotide-binding alpha-beta plait domain protein [Tanacetum coccineum]